MQLHSKKRTFISLLMISCLFSSAVRVYADSLAEEKSISPEHVTEEYAGVEGTLKIDADMEVVPDSVYQGTLAFEDVSFENGKGLYGKPEEWKESDYMKDMDTYEYGNEGIYLMKNSDSHYFSFETGKAEKEIPQSEMLSEEEAELFAENVIDILEVNAHLVGRFAANIDPEGVYSYIFGGTIENIPVAYMSPVRSQGSVEITGSQYSYVYYRYNYLPEEKTEVDLMDFSEILEKVEYYANAGYIQAAPSDLPVSRISLEYYVEETKEGLVFYPVWNFQVPYLFGTEPVELGCDTDDLFYINAVTGMLVKSI